MVHDIGDLFLNFAKMLRDMRLGPKWVLDISVVILCVAWVYPRCIATWLTYIYTGFYFVNGWIDCPNRHLNISEFTGYFYLWSIICVLWLMNLFWSAL